MNPTNDEVNNLIDKLTPDNVIELLGVSETDRTTLFNQLKALTTEQFTHYEKHFIPEDGIKLK